MPVDPVDRERLLVLLVTEDVEHARSGGDRASTEHPFDPLAKLLLRVELLKGTLAGNDPVALEIDRGVGSLPVEACGDDENLLGKIPRRSEDDHALVWVLDDVDDVAEIHNVGRFTFFVRKKRRIPTGHLNSHLVQP